MQATALAPMMIAWSFVFANFYGTFAAAPYDAVWSERIKPDVPNTQSAIAAFAAIFIL
jgi:hypothetical protein